MPRAQVDHGLAQTRSYRGPLKHGLTSNPCHPMFLLCALCVLCGPASALLEVRGGRFVDDGLPVFLRTAMYYQPHAFHHYFWSELDESMVAPDLEMMKGQGLNGLVLQVNWGAFMPAVDVERESFTWDEETEKKLVRILELAREKEMYVILWLTWARAPEGVGTKAHPARRDLGGKEHPPFSGYLLHDYPALAIRETFAWTACLAFHERVAKLTNSFGNVILDPLDWQHLNMNYWSWGDTQNLAVWREHLQRINPELQHWNERWSEKNATWEDVLLPIDTHVETTAARLAGSLYAGLPAAPYNAAKWQDFNEWHDAAFVRIARQIIQALERGSPRAPIGQRIDRWRYGGWRTRTWAPWQPEGDLELAPGRFFFVTYYPKERHDAEGTEKELSDTIRQVRERDECGYPIMVWETGIDLPGLYGDADNETREAAQQDHLDGVAATAERLGLLGLGWWVWRDYHMSAASLQYGLVGIDGTEKQAAELLRWAYGPESKATKQTDKAPPNKRQRGRK